MWSASRITTRASVAGSTAATPSLSSTTTSRLPCRQSTEQVDAMAGFAGRRAQALLIAILTYFAVTTAGLGIGAHWRHEDRAPGVMLLGSGSHVSILVVDGDARLLIASGDDASRSAMRSLRQCIP